MRKRFGLQIIVFLVFLGTILLGSPCYARTLSIYVADFTLDSPVEEDRWLGPFIADAIENNLKFLPDVRLVHVTESSPSDSSKSKINPSIIREAEAVEADYAIGGDVRKNGKALSIDAYIILVDEQERASEISFVCDISTLHSRLDYLSVSFARAIEISCSEEQSARMKRIPTSSLEAMTQYGEALASNPKSRDRRLHLLKALSEDRSYTDALSKLGLYYFQVQRFTEAQQILERLADIEPDYPYLNYNLGLVHASRKQYSQAIARYQKALETLPQDSDILNNLGRIYFIVGQHERATETFERALEASPDDPNVLANLRKINKKISESPPAKSEPEVASDSPAESELTDDEPDDPHYADELADQGRNYIERKMYAKAQATLEKLETVQPDYPHLYYNLGLVHASRKQYPRALAMYKKALISQPNDPDTWNNLGITYYALGRHEEAAEALESALEAQPDNPKALANFAIIQKRHPHIYPEESQLAKNINTLKQHVETGAAHYASGDYWRAAEEFAKALDLHPDNFKANNNIALAYERIGETEKAKEHFERALKADPTALDVRENLARFNKDEQTTQPAPEPAEPSLPTPNADTLIALGKVHLSREAYTEAIDDFSRALESSPDNIDALNGLGAALFSAGQYERASETFRKALSKNPEDVTAKQNLADTEFVMETLRGSSDGQDLFRLSIEPEIQARARTRRAQEFYNAGRYEHAVSEYRRALDLAPTSVEILNGLSNALFKMQRSREAEALLKKAQELDPDNELINCKLDVLAMTAWGDKPLEDREFEAVPSSSVVRAEKEAATGRTQFPAPGIESEPVLDMPDLSDLWDRGNSPAAASADPTNAQQAYFDTDPVDRDGMKLEEALLYYRKAVQLEPRDSDAQYNLGNIYFSLGAFHSAIDCYHAAGKIDPLFGQAYNNMGVAYYELGHLREAKAAWQQALKADPNLQSAKRNLNNLGVEETEFVEPAPASGDKDES